MRALQISAYGGDPLNVLELIDIPEPGAPGTGEVLIDVELAPLNLHDLLFMRGYFGGPPAPTVVGNEGFGRVAAVGPGVTNVKVGDHVLAPNLSLTWRERLIAPAQALFPLPDGDHRLQLAQLGSNPPTAALILSEYAEDASSAAAGQVERRGMQYSDHLHHGSWICHDEERVQSSSSQNRSIITCC